MAAGVNKVSVDASTQYHLMLGTGSVGMQAFHHNNVALPASIPRRNGCQRVRRLGRQRRPVDRR
jgi:hypothetical protein